MSTSTLFSYIASLAIVAVAITVLYREPKSGTRTSLLCCLCLLALESFFSGLAVNNSFATTEFWYRLRLIAQLQLSGCLLTFSLSYGRSNYAEYLTQWRTILRSTYILPIFVGVLCWSRLTVDTSEGMMTPPVLRLGWPGVMVLSVYIISCVLTLRNLEHTLRGSTGFMRWRVKYVVLGFALILGTHIYTSSQELVHAEWTDSLITINACALLVGTALILFALLRGKLASVDVYLSHQVLYRSVTIVVAGVYLLIVGMLSKLAQVFGGEFSSIVQTFLILITLLGLTVLLLSDRIRQHTKRFVSRHFRRPQHDYRRVWTLFMRHTASLMDTTSLCRAVTTFISEIFEVLSVTVWIMDTSQQRLEFGGSTSLTEARAKELIQPIMENPKILSGLRAQNEPIDLGTATAAWTSSLRKSNPDFFRLGHPICVPLKSQGELQGIMIVGDRVNNLAYTVEDLVLLQTIGDQVATSFLAIHMARQLLEARELEAFQTMSAFFVHDLKNTSSTLALMLQNLPRHFGDPEFREDSLQAIRKSVEKINDLIRRLTLLRKNLKLQTQRQDLNDVVQTTIESLAGTLPLQPELQLGDLPEISCDSDQLQTVFTNLILNARDATKGQGKITIHTDVADQRVILTVTDDGCGMTREYQEKELFRPFRSTKKEGMGIGLFHSRAIVEAHHGSLEATSKIHEGSTFRVILPITGESYETTPTSR